MLRTTQRHQMSGMGVSASAEIRIQAAMVVDVSDEGASIRMLVEHPLASGKEVSLDLMLGRRDGQNLVLQGCKTVVTRCDPSSAGKGWYDVVLTFASHEDPERTRLEQFLPSASAGAARPGG